jgi:hypothetical protein
VKLRVGCVWVAPSGVLRWRRLLRGVGVLARRAARHPRGFLLHRCAASPPPKNPLEPCFDFVRKMIGPPLGSGAVLTRATAANFSLGLPQWSPVP